MFWEYYLHKEWLKYSFDKYLLANIQKKGIWIETKRQNSFACDQSKFLILRNNVCKEMFTNSKSISHQSRHNQNYLNFGQLIG